MRKNRNILTTSIATIVMLCLLLITEYLWYLFFKSKGNPEEELCLWQISIILTAIFLIIMVWGVATKAYKPSVSITARFFQSGFSATWISIIFLVLFLVHISWLADNGFEFFVDKKDKSWYIVINILSIIGLVLLFPAQYKTLGQENILGRTILVSAFSRISPFSIEGFLKPFSRYPNIDKVLLLISNAALKFEDERMEKNIKDYMEKIPEERRYLLRKVYYSTDYDEKRKALCEFIQICIKDQIGYEGKEVKIILSETVDYNSFEQCYDETKALLTKHEKGETEHTIINTSPGTAAVSGVMAILAIIGDRQLVYTTQEQNVESKLVPVALNLTAIEDVYKQLSKENENS